MKLEATDCLAVTELDSVGVGSSVFRENSVSVGVTIVEHCQQIA
jgi:hypothetical protein